MGKVFSKIFGKKSKTTKRDKAMLDMKIQRDKVKVYKKRLEKVIEKEIEMAKKLLKNKKKARALLILKKKKIQEKMLNNADAQLTTLEEMIAKVEFAEIESKIFEGLKNGTSALQSIQKEMSLEDVEKLMEETQEAIALQDEIGEALSGQLTDEDASAVDEDLEELESQMMDELNLEVNIPQDNLEANKTKNKNKDKMVDEGEEEAEEEEGEEEEAGERTLVGA